MWSIISGLVSLDGVLNFLKGLGLLAVFLAIVYFVSDYTGLKSDLATSRANEKQWQSNYETAAQAQREGEETIQVMREDFDAMQEDLLDWQGKQYQTQQDLSAAQKRIRRLEKENEAIRAFLDTPVPCELWLQIWPNSPKCPN